MGSFTRTGETNTDTAGCGRSRQKNSRSASSTGCATRYKQKKPAPRNRRSNRGGMVRGARQGKQRRSPGSPRVRRDHRRHTSIGDHRNPNPGTKRPLEGKSIATDPLPAQRVPQTPTAIDPSPHRPNGSGRGRPQGPQARPAENHSGARGDRQDRRGQPAVAPSPDPAGQSGRPPARRLHPSRADPLQR